MPAPARCESARQTSGSRRPSPTPSSVSPRPPAAAPGAGRVRSGAAGVRRTPTEFDLLVCLAAAPGQVLTREKLLADVWGWPAASGTRTVDSHVKALRAK